MIAVCRFNNRTKVIPLRNKSFESLFSALQILKSDQHFAHIKTILSDKESALKSGKPKIPCIFLKKYLSPPPLT